MGENKESKNRILFLDCAGSGMVRQMNNFFEENYEYEYCDNLRPVGSIYSLLVNRTVVYMNESKKKFVLFRNSLIIAIDYLVNEHKLNKIVVVSEPKCALYKDLCFFDSINLIDKFSSQKEAFREALKRLRNFVTSITMRYNYNLPIEAWYVIFENGRTVFEKVIFEEEG